MTLSRKLNMSKWPVLLHTRVQSRSSRGKHVAFAQQNENLTPVIGRKIVQKPKSGMYCVILMKPSWVAREWLENESGEIDAAMTSTCGVYSLECSHCFFGLIRAACRLAVCSNASASDRKKESKLRCQDKRHMQ